METIVGRRCRQGAVVAVILALATAPAIALQDQALRGAGIELVTLPVADSPLVALRVMFRAGSIHDPVGKEGLSALTALMVGNGGTSKRSYGELVDAMYPMAARINVVTDREVIVLAAQVHRDSLGEFSALFEEAVLAPGFREEDFARHRDQLRAFLTTTLRSANDELLGLELIQQHISAGHPYGHAPAGTLDGLDRITLDDVKGFYRQYFTRANALLGVGGGYATDFPARLAGRLEQLPPGMQIAPTVLPDPPVVKGRHFTIVEKPTESVGIHFGYALPITRADNDFYPLMVANSYLGQHRTSHGRLMQELRGKRGLNYGDYSYIEHWDNPPGTTNPAPNTPRRQQYFSVWVRPVAPQHALFALRAAMSEVDRLVAHGMTHEEFELTRHFLISYSKLWARSLGDRLGFQMDSRFYDMPYFIDAIERQLSSLTVDHVNAAARKYLQTTNYTAVMIAGGGEALRQGLLSAQPSPVTYANRVAADVISRDATIAALPLAPASVHIVPIEQTFTQPSRPAR